jgi:hypothetical protein
MGGHKGDSSGRSGEESTKYVQDQIRPLIDKYASSLGITLTPDQINEIMGKVVTPFAPGGVVFDANRGAALDEAKAFLLPTISQYKMNPTATTDMTVKAGDTIKSVLGRDATPDEAAYFAKELAQGKSAYELQQELMSLPEYQKTLAAKDRAMLGDELLQQQQLAFQKATPTIISQFMKAGRLGSSGLDAAMAKAQQELEQQRQGYLGQVGYNDISSIRGNAYNNYNNAAQQFQGMYGNTAQTGNQYNMLGGAIGRMNELSDYARQQNDYMNYLNYAKPKNNTGQMLGTLAGGAIGGYFGGPAGAGAGAQMGGAAGSYFG